MCTHHIGHAIRIVDWLMIDLIMAADYLAIRLRADARTQEQTMANWKALGASPTRYDSKNKHNQMSPS